MHARDRLTTMASPLPEQHPQQTSGVKASLEAIYNWNYASEIDQLRTLYANALDRQWNAMRDLDWESEIDRAAFSRTFSLAGVPIQETGFWQDLGEDMRWEVSRRSAAFMLSNFLHGEQGALMVAAQLVNAVPHMDGKFYAATQTLDEARHTGYGVKYLSAVVPTLSLGERAELEDFAFESARLLIDSRAGNSIRETIFKLWASLGIDMGAALASILKDRERIVKGMERTGGRLGPVRGFVIPTLHSIGLYSERVRGRFDEMFRANLGDELARQTSAIPDLPDDLEAWVNQGYENV